MFYWLSTFRLEFFPLNIFKYITFRAGMAAVTTFLICIFVGPFFIKMLKKFHFGEKPVEGARAEVIGKEHFESKKEVPTMGGLLIVGSILGAVLLWSDLSNPYVWLTILTMVWLAMIGFIDDLMKIKGWNKGGMPSGVKMIWQVALAMIISYVVYAQLNVSTILDVPFLKNVSIHLGVFYILIVMLVVVGSSNAVNFTDGLDGLAIGCTLMVAIAMSVLCYVSGHINFSEYLLIPYIPRAGELTVFCGAIVGASLGFLWFNCYPASVFMGDVGALALGGTLGMIAVFIKKELLFAVLGLVFVWEVLSVMIQVASFKLTGKRVFLCAPFHHHLQKINWKESKIVTRFWIVSIILVLVTLMTLKIR